MFCDVLFLDKKNQKSRLTLVLNATMKEKNLKKIKLGG